MSIARQPQDPATPTTGGAPSGAASPRRDDRAASGFFLRFLPELCLFVASLAMLVAIKILMGTGAYSGPRNYLLASGPAVASILMGIVGVVAFLVRRDLRRRGV